MTRTPSSLTLALLRFIESENEALAGDLAEGWRAGRSTRWFWTQMLSAVVVVAWRKRVPTPAVVRLVTATPFDRPDRTPGRIDPATLGLGGVAARGRVGGGGLLGIVLLITIFLPHAWWLVLGGLTGGVLLGIVMVIRRHDGGLAGSGGPGPLSLFGPPAASRDGSHSASPGSKTTRLAILKY